MGVAVNSNKQSTKVYINNVLCHSRKVDVTNMTLPYAFVKPSVVVYEDEIHILGGYHLKWDGIAWVQVSTMPTNDNGCAVIYDGEIHFFTSSAHYGWDGEQWNTYTLPNVDMTNSNCIVFDGELHILGGENNPTMHYKWDGSEWSEVSTLPVNFNMGSAVVYDNKLHILSNTSHYTWNGASWVSESTIPVVFKNGDAVALDKIYVIGCGDSNSQSYIWDGSEWTEDIGLTIPLVNGKVVNWGESIYCLGGTGYFKMCLKYGSDIIIGNISLT